MCLLLLSGSLNSSTTLHGGDGGGKALFSVFKKCPQLILLPIVAQDEGLEGYPQDQGFGQNTVQDSGVDLTDTWEAGFTKALARDLVLGKKTVLGVEIIEVQNVGLS